MVIRKPCPACGQTGGLALILGLAAMPIGSFSIAGAQNKVVARSVAVLACSGCQATWTGHLEGVETDSDGTVTAGHFVEDPCSDQAPDRDSGQAREDQTGKAATPPAPARDLMAALRDSIERARAIRSDRDPDRDPDETERKSE